MRQAEQGRARIEWARGQMPVLAQIAKRFAAERPLAGLRVGACLHITAETANLAQALRAGGASLWLSAANPLSSQDDVLAALASEDGICAQGCRGSSEQTLRADLRRVADCDPHIVLDDGADLLMLAAAGAGERSLLGGMEETTTGLLRLRGMAGAGELPAPVLAVNESHAERTFNDRYGTGQSALDGILRATNIMLAGRTLVVIGYGPTGRGIALRARGAGASVLVCEVDPVRALEARMEGYQVLPAIQAAVEGDVFVTVTGSRDVLRAEHFRLMKDGSVLANAGHFDVEIALADLAELAGDRRRAVLELVDQYTLPDGRRLNLIAQGRVVNLAAGEGHPAAVMDISFAIQALCAEHIAQQAHGLERAIHRVPERIDQAVAELKLASLGVQIDALDERQLRYRELWRGA